MFSDIALQIEDATIEAMMERRPFTTIGFPQGELYAIINGYPQRIVKGWTHV